jgi:hypothetical protein
MYQNFIIPYLYEAQHVSGDTPPITRSLKLHWQPLVFYTWKVVKRVVGGPCQAYVVVAVLFVVVGPASRPDHDQQHCYHHTPTVKLETATAADVCS